LNLNDLFFGCHKTEKDEYRGELAYKTRTTKLNNGLTGIQTWFRGPQGESSTFQTYGFGLSANEEVVHQVTAVELKQNIDVAKYDEVGRKAYGFWQHSSATGRSEYLERKNVGCYGIRFRNNMEYGDVAVIPMIDSLGRLWSYQLLNPDGTKRQPKGARTEGLLHMVGNPVNGQLVGIAESYVTSASCFELTGIPTACAFSCQNLKNIAIIFKQRYLKSKLVIFADNDRHLEERGAANQGFIKGQEAIYAIEGDGFLVIPDFGNSEACKGLSDWNDLIQLKGFEYAKAQVLEQLKKKASMAM